MIPFRLLISRLFLLSSSLLVPGLTGCSLAPAGPKIPPPVATFSIAAFDPETGDLGVAVQSKFFGVGSVVPFASADVGAVASQAFANPTWGPDGLALLRRGVSPQRALEVLVERDPGAPRRQAGMVDAKGRAMAWTGPGTMEWAGHVVGEGHTCQGNLLAGPEVVSEMSRAFGETEGPLPERLVAALVAGQAAGGDRRGRQSAALLVVRRGGGYAGFTDRYVDLRVEDHPRPIEELSRLLRLHRSFYGEVPLPGELTGFVSEGEVEPGSPRAVFDEWTRRLRNEDWPGLHALYSAEYRRDHPLPEFEREMVERAEGILAFLEHATWAGTKFDGDRARGALSSPGSPRPALLSFVREEGTWYLAD